jgi:ATP-dependent DNA helicase RecG
MTNKELTILISKGEGLTVEFKSNFNIDVIETLVAFSNTKGGMIVVGVSDKGTVTGTKTNAESIQNWINGWLFGNNL